MKTFLLIPAALCLQFISLAQSFEKTIDAPGFIAPCSDANRSSGLKVREFNNSFFLLSEINLESNAQCPVNGAGYSISRVDQNGDTMYSSFTTHPNLETTNHGAFYASDFTIGPDSSIYVLGLEDVDDQTELSVFITKHSITGAVIWKQNFPSTTLNAKVIEIDDSLLFIGGTKLLGADEHALAIVQMTTDGIMEWSGYSQSTHSAEEFEIVKRDNDLVLIGQGLPTSSSIHKVPFVVPFKANWIDPNIHTYTVPNHDYWYVDAIYDHNHHLILAAHDNGLMNVHLFEIDNSNAQVGFHEFPQEVESPDAELTNIIENQDSNLVLSFDNAYVNTLNQVVSMSILLKEYDPETENLIRYSEFSGFSLDMIADEDGHAVISGNRYNQNFGDDLWIRTSLIMRTDEDLLTPECQPQFLIDSVFVFDEELGFSFNSGVINLYNNSYGEVSDFHWNVNGTFLSEDVHTSFEVIHGEWNTVELVACGTSFIDSFYVAESQLGISELQTSKLSVYPNPVLDHFSLGTDQSGVISVFDLEGKCVYNEKYLPGNIISTEFWSKGVYTLKLRSEDGVFRARVLK